MRTRSIVCFGVIALFGLEVAYSMEIQKYDISMSKAPRSFSFCGPVTATLKSILNLDAPGAPTSIRSI